MLDLYSRRVIGWSISERMTVRLTCDALRMALQRRGRPRGVIVHSDRGSQYCAMEYRALLTENGLHCSMSARGDCYDNAAMESWNHSLKVEAVHGERFITRAQAKNQLFDYIEVYYNRRRLHSYLGYVSPVQFEFLSSLDGSPILCGKIMAAGAFNGGGATGRYQRVSRRFAAITEGTLRVWSS